MAEIVLRIVDGYPLNQLRIPDRNIVNPEVLSQKSYDYAKAFERPDDVKMEWFFSRPPEREPRYVDEKLWQTHQDFDRKAPPIYQGAMLKIWNYAFLKENVCTSNYKPMGADFKALEAVLAFKPKHNLSHTRYRYIPHASYSSGGPPFNNFGWLGPDVQLRKPPNTIRVAFVGASTTQNSHGWSFSYPELVGHWLNKWANASGHDLTFEALNLGREGILSADIAAIVRDELLPVEPDIVCYYAGSNEFYRTPLLPVKKLQKQLPTINQRLSGYSALLRRIDLLLSYRLKEPEKPHNAPWPENVDEINPDISSDHLPCDLSEILRNLDSIKMDISKAGGELILCSFVMAVEDGMKLHPVRNQGVYQYWNEEKWPLKYADIKRFLDFQNRVYKAYAKKHGINFLDIAAAMPIDPDIFKDGIHMYEETISVRAWLTFLKLLPILKQKIELGEFPKPGSTLYDKHPNIDALEPWFKVSIKCNCPNGIDESGLKCLNFYDSTTYLQESF